MKAGMNKEVWKDVEGYEGRYKVSSYGRIKSFFRGNPRILSNIPCSIGYDLVQLHAKGKVEHRYVQHMVLEAFVGPRPKGFVCCHYDGNKINNHISNLRWDSQSENMRDGIRHGVVRIGSRSNLAKLKEFDVHMIKDRLRKGERQKDIAKIFGVIPATISAINCGKSWAHIS